MRQSVRRCSEDGRFDVALIEPHQDEVIEKPLRPLGLWRCSRRRPPPNAEGLVHDLDGCFSDSQTGELTFVDMGTFLATF